MYCINQLIYIKSNNDESPYNLVSDRIEWIIFDFAKTGKLNIYIHGLNRFIENITIDKIEHKRYGEIQIKAPKCGIIITKMTWIQ